MSASRSAAARFRPMALLALAMGVVGVASASGCYSRVVDAKGPGADQYEVSERYQEESSLDRWFWGDTGEKRNKSLLDRRSR